MRNSRKLSLAICLVLVAVVAIVPMFALSAFAADDITFKAPDGVEIGSGSATSLPAASSYNGYTFVGWSETKVEDGTTNAPTIYGAGTEYIGTATMLYAVYTYEAIGEAAGFVLADIADIQSTDVVVVVSNKSGDRYALSNNNGTGSAPSAVSVTVSADEITSDVADTIKWNIESTTDGYIFYPNGTTGTWLYSTSTNNGTRVGTNTAKYWVLDSSGYFKHVGTSRYLGVYNNSNWRSYTNTTGNTAGQTFELYVESSGSVIYYTSGDVEACAHANTTTDTTAAGCTEDGQTIVTCNDCGIVVSTTPIEATGHSYENGACTVCGEEEPLEATLTFDGDKANRTEYSTSKQVWAQNGITFTNEKASSSTNVADYGNPVRLYKGSSITVEAGGNMITKIVFNCTSGYVLSTSIAGATATADGIVVTVVLDTPAKEFTISSLSAQTRFSSLTVYYEASECAHENTTTVTTDATCTENGQTTITCDDCGVEVNTTAIPAPGHNYVNGACTVCGYLDGTNVPTGDIVGISSTIDFSDKANRVQLDADMQIWRQNGVVLINNKAESGTNVADYADPVRFYKSSTLTISSAKEIVKINIACDSTTYADSLATSIGEAATVYGKVVVVNLATPATSYTISLTDGAVRVDSLTAFYEEELPAIAEASVTIGTNLAMNYTVTIPLGYDFSDIYMVFTMNNVATTVAEYTETNSGYAFSFTRLAPQCMGDSIKAELYMDGEVVVTYDNFSVKAYAEKLLALNPGDAELATLVADMLNYGAAAQQYVGYKTDALVNAGYETAGSNAEPTESDMTVAESSNANFGIISAGVRFDYVNQIYVKFGIRAAALEGAAPTVVVAFNGVEQTVTLDGEGEYIVYSGAISALEFGKVYTIELKVDGEVVQTLTYSVNSYVFAKKDGNNAMAELAIALYRYGNSAVAYSEK